MTLADRIVVLNEGVIMQAGSPRELYNRPQNLFVAEFIGSPKMNLMKCEVATGKIRLQSKVPQDSGITASDDNVAWLGVRPEDITVGTADGAAISGTVAVCMRILFWDPSSWDRAVCFHRLRFRRVRDRTC